MTRARWILVALAAVFGLLFLTGCLVVGELGGAFSHEPGELSEGLSTGARRLVRRVNADVGPKLVDHHVHLVGLGNTDSGAFVNPEMRSWLHPIQRLRFSIYADAAGIDDMDRADQEYVERLVDLIRNIDGHGRYQILAFDQHYRPDGTVDLEHTEFHVPNEYAFRIAEAHPDCFRPAMSVHPYRKDALPALERWAARGSRCVKWLPNAMGIDPADPRCEPYYRKMKELGLVLLTHSGKESAVEAEDFQAFGNPLRLRKPLSMGVTVLAAHCGSLGTDEDLDDPERPHVESSELFIRMLEDDRYAGRLFGEISATTHSNRLPDPLLALLEREELHPRLVYGSDYPIPAINVVLRTRDLVREGLINEIERKHLNEIYEYNPLLFDLAVKRTVKHPETGTRFPASVFTADPTAGS